MDYIVSLLLDFLNEIAVEATECEARMTNPRHSIFIRIFIWKVSVLAVFHESTLRIFTGIFTQIGSTTICFRYSSEAGGHVIKRDSNSDNRNAAKM